MAIFYTKLKNIIVVQHSDTMLHAKEKDKFTRNAVNFLSQSLKENCGL